MNEILEYINKPELLQTALNFIFFFSISFAFFYAFISTWMIGFILPGAFFFYGLKDVLLRIGRCYQPVLSMFIICLVIYSMGILYTVDLNIEFLHTLLNMFLKSMSDLFPKMYLPLAFFWTIQILWGVYLKNKPKDS